MISFGIIFNQVVTRKDFSAFGDETFTAQRTQNLGYKPENIRQDYTGYQKDDESGLEYAQARYYNSSHGRFTSVDPLTASASIRDPQTFNRYSYALNSPYKFTDPLGLLPQGRRSNDGSCGAEHSSCTDEYETTWDEEVEESHTDAPAETPATENTEEAAGQPAAEPPVEPPPAPDQNEETTILGDDPARVAGANITFGNKTFKGEVDAFGNVLITINKDSLSETEQKDLFENKKDFSVSVNLEYDNAKYEPIDTKFSEVEQTQPKAIADKVDPSNKKYSVRMRDANSSYASVVGDNNNIRVRNEGSVTFNTNSSGNGIKSVTANFRAEFHDSSTSKSNSIRLNVVTVRSDYTGLQRQNLTIKIAVK